MNLTNAEKADLFDRLLAPRFDQLTRIDLVSGTAENLYASRPEWERTVGVRYRYEDMVERFLLDRCADADTDAVIERLMLPAILEGLGQCSLYSVYYTIRGADGRLETKRLYFARESETTVIATIEDITEPFAEVFAQRSRLEDELVRARDTINEKSAFLRLMSRNIRAPLYSIMGLTRLAQEHPGDQSSFDSYLHKISMSGTYMSETIDDVLDLRRIARGELDLHPEQVVLADVFSRISDLIHPVIYEKGLLFTLNADSVFSLRVMADSYALQQVFVKLLHSAISYTVSGGRIALNVRELFRSGGSVTLEMSVENKGLVIDHERLQTLFRPYDYLVDKIDSELELLDMDLIILKSYLMAMGTDTILAESDERKGTRVTVTLTLPLVSGSLPTAVSRNNETGGQISEADGQISETGAQISGAGGQAEVTEDRGGVAEQADGTSASPAAGTRTGRTGQNGSSRSEFTGRRVLLVDDNEINLDVTARILTDWGAIVTRAINGRDAIGRFAAAQGQFDLILMDVMMPEMDGLEAARRIRGMKKIRDAARIPIIAMTANAFRENFEESFRAGMDAHLVKPIDPERLYRVIADALRN